MRLTQAVSLVAALAFASPLLAAPAGGARARGADAGAKEAFTIAPRTVGGPATAALKNTAVQIRPSVFALEVEDMPVSTASRPMGVVVEFIEDEIAAEAIKAGATSPTSKLRQTTAEVE